MTEAREGYKLDLAAEVLSRGGTIRLQALGSSMLPSIWSGDVVSIESKSGKEIVPGDIVLVARDGRFFIHRLIEKHNAIWITRGDSLLQDDAPVAQVQVLGKVALIHRKSGGIVPKPRVSRFGSMLAWILCRWDFFRNVALRIHSSWSNIPVAPPSRRLPWGRPRHHWRGQHELATTSKMLALPEPR
jgi:Peptidase S24-like